VSNHPPRPRPFPQASGKIPSKPRPSRFNRLTQFAFPYILIAITIMLVLVGIQAIEGKQQADLNHQVICSFRNDLAHRVHQSQRIVEENPELIKQFGLTQAQVQNQIQNQLSTLDSLDEAGLVC